ncbi:MAG: NADH-quinone oxidoreductase subunit C [Streptomyces sp.]|uniref:NADH-quinone oxidoreductase subunit C n=1 Tax=Streptomyces sp. TaxID=1931 RepID=UPI0025D88927|nr:NADH-quinone oxidoreductase subunit C [Streptomyces sp.]MBW8801738.1 NADH-quinone oxidoreductase subunit C [Streptomyces sp.]
MNQPHAAARSAHASAGTPGWVQDVTAARDGGAVFFDFLTAVDLEADGFQVVCRLWDPEQRTEQLLTTHCPREDPRVPSVVGVFAGAAWHERAVADLFGIVFEGHDTQPLLLPPGFEGHPLRKDFPLAAREAKQWPGAKDPGESDADLLVPKRRRAKPLGARDWPS